MGKQKCSPNAGWIGEVIVNPNRFRKDASRTAGTERSPRYFVMNLDLEWDGRSSHDSMDCFNDVAILNEFEPLVLANGWART